MIYVKNTTKKEFCAKRETKKGKNLESRRVRAQNGKFKN